MEIKRGDVVLVVAQGDMGKPRPGIVVQASGLLAGADTVLVCPLTSEVTRNLPLRPIIVPSAENGLISHSQVMTERLSAIRRGRVRRVLGSLEAAMLVELDEALLLVLGLSR